MDFAALLARLNQIQGTVSEAKDKKVDEEQTEEGNEFSGELAKAKAAGKKEFEVDGKKYQVKEAEDKQHNDEKSEDLDESDDEDNNKEDKDEISESELKEKAAPGQEDWIKSNKEKFIKQYGKKKGMEVLYATSWKRSKKKDESKNLEECYDQAMMGSRPEQESGMNINASTDTRTGSKSLTVTAQGKAAEQLAQLLKLSGISNGGTAHDAEMEEAAYVNTPEPEVQGIEVQMQQGNDLNRPKNSYPKVSGGDNPMNMREAQELAALEKQLSEALAEFKVSRGVAEAKKGGKPDFLDMDKDGDRKETMKKALADKKAPPKRKVSEAEFKRRFGALLESKGIQPTEALLEAGWRDWVAKGKKYAGAAALGGALALGAMGGDAQARVTPGGDGVSSMSAAQQMQVQKPGGSQLPGGGGGGGGAGGGSVQNFDKADSIDKDGAGNITLDFGGQKYKVQQVSKGDPVPRGAKMIKVSQGELGQKGIGSYSTYLMPNGTAFMYSLP